jgi:ABC-type glycerol-3-phosphate transport system substrate-binding protein
MKKLCMMMVVAAGLSACGGGSSFNGQVNAPDAFLVEVMRVVALDANNAPPESIEALVATMLDNTEPVALN